MSLMPIQGYSPNRQDYIDDPDTFNFRMPTLRPTRPRPMMSSMDRDIFGRPSVDNTGKFMDGFGRQIGEAPRLGGFSDRRARLDNITPVPRPQPLQFTQRPVEEFRPIQRPSVESLQQPQFGQQPQFNQQGMQQMMQFMQQMMQMFSMMNGQGGRGGFGGGFNQRPPMFGGGFGGGMGGGFGGGFMNQGPYGGGFGQGGYQQPRQRPMPNMFGNRGREQLEMQYGFDGRPIGMGLPTNMQTFM